MLGQLAPTFEEDRPDCVCCDAEGVVDQLCINPFANIDDKPMSNEKMDMDGKDGKGGRGDDMMMAPMAFLGVAIGQFTMIALNTFRYKSSSTYYDNGDVLGTNWWKYSNQLSAYSGLVLWGTATFTQLMSVLDLEAFVSLNLLVWTVGIG